MPKNIGGKHPDGTPARADDPRRNAGISLTGSRIAELDDFKAAAGLDSRSAVVDLLIEKGLPQLWWDHQLQQP